jgi:hypothetical protein
VERRCPFKELQQEQNWCKVRPQHADRYITKILLLL